MRLRLSDVSCTTAPNSVFDGSILIRYLAQSVFFHVSCFFCIRPGAFKCPEDKRALNGNRRSLWVPFPPPFPIQISLFWLSPLAHVPLAPHSIRYWFTTSFANQYPLFSEVQQNYQLEINEHLEINGFTLQKMQNKKQTGERNIVHWLCPVQLWHHGVLIKTKIDECELTKFNNIIIIYIYICLYLYVIINNNFFCRICKWIFNFGPVRSEKKPCHKIECCDRNRDHVAIDRS